jgi:sugar-specific transcriptional regulator TrmB
LLTLGEVTAIKISKVTGLHRQFVYDALYALKEKDMVLQFGTERSTWKALSPHQLTAYFERKQNQAILTSEQLLQYVSKGNAQRFEVIQGKAAFRARQIDMIKQLEPNTCVYIICGQWETYFDHIGQETYETWQKIRKEKNIVNKFIGPTHFEKHMASVSLKQELTEYKVIQGLDTGLVNTVIYGDVVDFEIYGEPHITFSIVNKSVAESQKQFFESLWKK